MATKLRAAAVALAFLSAFQTLEAGEILASRNRENEMLWNRAIWNPLPGKLSPTLAESTSWGIDKTLFPRRFLGEEKPNSNYETDEECEHSTKWEVHVKGEDAAEVQKFLRQLVLDAGVSKEQVRIKASKAKKDKEENAMENTCSKKYKKMTAKYEFKVTTSDLVVAEKVESMLDELKSIDLAKKLRKEGDFDICGASVPKSSVRLDCHKKPEPEPTPEPTPEPEEKKPEEKETKKPEKETKEEFEIRAIQWLQSLVMGNRH